MKETVRSLRLYFLLVGAVGGFLHLGIIASRATLPVLLIGLPSVAVAGAFLYAGVKLEPLLANNATLVRRIIYANGALVALGMIMNGLAGDLAAVGSGAVGLAIAAYLLVNVRRLSDQAHATSDIPLAEAGETAADVLTP